MYNTFFSIINLFYVLFDCAKAEAMGVLNGKEHRAKELIQPHISLLLKLKKTEYLLSKFIGCKNKLGSTSQTFSCKKKQMVQLNHLVDKKKIQILC